MQPDIVDYRNGKYQGPLNTHKQRHGLGIFIDDDLTFHVSEWQQNQLSGSTLVYLTHGKYMYGTWKNNEPHGLNVYRSGDTVLLSIFNQGLPSQRCLLIFQTHNFACVLGQSNGEWEVSQSGPIPNHQTLLSYIQQVGFNVPDSYFSLTKFACSFSNMNKAIKTFPCLANYCYFGYINGLAIVFNPNNGVVSVGHHCNQVLSEFGGKFQGIRKAEEGNFEAGGEVVTYSGQRPSNQIYSIFQCLHKKSLNFHNQYFDSKSKVFSSIEAILRGKLKDIAEQGMKRHQFANLNLNDSLDFHDYNEEQSLKNYQNRQRMYSPPKKSMQRGPIKLDRSPTKTQISKANTSRQKTPPKTPLLNKQSQLEEFQFQIPNKIKQKNMNKESSHRKVQSIFKFEQQTPQLISCQKPSRSPYRYKQTQICQSFVRKDSKEVIQSGYSRQSVQTDQKDTASKETLIKTSINQKTRIFEESALKAQSSRKACFEKNLQYKQPLFPKNKEDESSQRQRSPTFKGLIEQMENKYKLNQIQHLHPRNEIINKIKDKNIGQILKRTDVPQDKEAQQIKPRSSTLDRNKKFDINALPRPTYEEIEERRKRVLRDFQELNISSELVAKKSQEPSLQNISSGNCYQVKRKDSQQSTFAFMPLTISNRQRNLTPNRKEKPLAKQQTVYKEKKLLTRAASEFSTPCQDKKHKQIGQATIQKGLQLGNDQNCQISYGKRAERVQNAVAGKQPEGTAKNTVASSIQNSISPSRQKRTYVYVFQ